MRFNEFAPDLGALMRSMISGSSPFASAEPSGTPTDSSQTGAGLQNFKSNGAQVDPNTMKQYLAGKGLSNNHIAGLLVNIKWESHFKPGAYVGSDAGQGPSGGLFGFHDPSHDGKGNFSNMVKATGGPDKWQTNWQGQLDHALSSGPGREYVARSFNSPAEAASWWVINYEKPANTQQQAQARAAEAHRYA